MNNNERSLKFWGVRGTTPTPAGDRLRYGGNTICLGADLGAGQYLVLDCGSGIRLLGQQIQQAGPDAPTVHILMSHYHFDHIEGLPLFQPLYNPNATLRIHGAAPEGLSLRQTLEGFVCPPYFPVRISGAPSTIDYVELRGTSFSVADVQIDTLPLNHPDGCLAFRLRRRDRTIVFATDHEHGDAEVDQALVEFARSADHLIYDATYVPTEYERLRKGWGHSTWFAAIGTARDAGVGNLILFHHHPDHSDDDLDKILEIASRDFPSIDVAREGMEIPF